MEFDFGDGGHSYQAAPEHTYLEPGRVFTGFATVVDRRGQAVTQVCPNTIPSSCATAKADKGYTTGDTVALWARKTSVLTSAKLALSATACYQELMMKIRWQPGQTKLPHPVTLCSGQPLQMLRHCCHCPQKFTVTTAFSTPTALPPPAELQLVAQVDHAAGSAMTVPPLLTIAAPLTPGTNASLSLSVPGGSARFRTDLSGNAATNGLHVCPSLFKLRRRSLRLHALLV